MRLRSILLFLFTCVGAATAYYVLKPSSLRSLKQPPYQYVFPIDQLEEKSERIDTLREALKSQKDSLVAMTELAQALLKRARETNSSNDYKEAEALAEQIIKFSTKPLQAELIRIEALQHRHEFREAELILATLLKLKPDETSLLDLSTRLALARGQYDLALSSAKRLTEVLPRSGSYAMLAQVYEAIGDTKAAESSYRHAFQIEDLADVSGSAYLRALYGRFYLRRGHPAEAAVLISEGLRLRPKSPFLIALEADVAFASQDYTKAEKIYFAAFDLSPSPIFLLKAAKSRAHEGKKEKALELVDQTIELIETSSNQAGGKQYNLELASALIERERKSDLISALALIEEELHSRTNAELLALKVKTLRAINKPKEADAIFNANRAQLSARPDLF